MIKVQNDTVIIKGLKHEICAETVILLKKLKELIGCEMYTKVLRLAEMSEEEVHNESEKILDKIFGEFFGDILKHGKTPNEDILKDLREAMKREREE